MGKLIVPRHTADLDYIIPAMKIYYDSKEWVDTATYKDKLVASLIASGKESSRNSDETHYTKCSEIPRYFGFLERLEPGKASSDVRITDSGISFYEAYERGDTSAIQEIIIESLENVTFGRNNEGCGSNVDCEAPNVVVVASLLLDGITNKEAAFILGEFLKNTNLSEILLTVKYSRLFGDKLKESTVTSDIKFIPFFKRIGFMEDADGGLTIVKKEVVDKFRKRLEALPLTNTETTDERLDDELDDESTLEFAELNVGDVSEGGKLTIVDKDRLCYLVKSVSNNAEGTRTISKEILAEFVNYLKDNPNATADEIRNELVGKSRVDKFEYGYAATLRMLASMILKGKRRKKQKLGPLQQIFYGAPGTGKSFAIKKETEGRAVVRTTFHPDSDYSTFVGAYKPTSVDVPVMTIIGKEQVPVVNAKPEKKIVYEFVPQAFLKAYTGAWKNQDEPFFLVIEEINRGNCAQIFGDLFQLLDRNDETGLSDYPISPDEDIQKFLLTDKKFGFAELTEEQKAAIPEEVQSGELLILPKNLYIWATMNTSDQSLFPIDSAFKRRWDWKYVPIYNSEEGWQIEVKGARYDWWDFLEKMNDKISTTTHSEDKKLGYYFCKTKDGIINAETFVGKVIFYVWNDVFKDFAEEVGNLFKDENGDLLSYDKFYGVGADGNTKVLEDKVALFLEHLEVKPVNEEDSDDEEEDEEDTSDLNTKGLYLKYNGSVVKRKNARKEYRAVMALIAQDEGVQNLANVVPNELMQDPPAGSTKNFKPLDGQEGWFLATNHSIDQFTAILKKIKQSLNINLESQLF